MAQPNTVLPADRPIQGQHNARTGCRIAMARGRVPEAPESLPIRARLDEHIGIPESIAVKGLKQSWQSQMPIAPMLLPGVLVRVAVGTKVEGIAHILQPFCLCTIPQYGSLKLIEIFCCMLIWKVAIFVDPARVVDGGG